MTVETTVFAQIIEDHLRLKARNAKLEDTLPIGRYKSDDPFENHPLFKTEEQARLEETMDGEVTYNRQSNSLTWPGEDTADAPLTAEHALWGRSREFDWGD